MSEVTSEVEQVSQPSGEVDLVKAEAPGDVEPTGRITFQTMADRLTLGLLASVIGGVLVFVSSFLTWASTTSKSSAGKLVSGATTDTLGIDGSRLGGATLVLSIAALALVGVMLLPATKSYAWKLLIGAGALVVLLAITELFQIPGTLHPTKFTCPAGVTCSFHRSIGPGVWFTLVAGLLIAVGAYVHHIRPVHLRPEADNVISRPQPEASAPVAGETSAPQPAVVPSKPKPRPVAQESAVQEAAPPAEGTVE